VSASRRHPRLRFDKAAFERLFRVLEDSTGPKPPAGTLSIVFLDDDQLARIHAKFLGDPAPTDVITFPGFAPENFAGEICVSCDRAASESRKRGIPFARELTLYLIHGWLHLAGFDDHTSNDRRDMRRAERRLLAILDKYDAIPGFRLAP